MARTRVAKVVARAGLGKEVRVVGVAMEEPCEFIEESSSAVR